MMLLTRKKSLVWEDPLEEGVTTRSKSGLTLCDRVGSSVHGILQTRMLEWVAMPSSGDLPDPRMDPGSPVLPVDSLTSETPGER